MELRFIFFRLAWFVGTCAVPGSNDSRAVAVQHPATKAVVTTRVEPGAFSIQLSNKTLSAGEYLEHNRSMYSGSNNCIEGWEEVPKNCPNCSDRDEFPCRNGKFVPQRCTCNSQNDCGDMSDEDTAHCQGRNLECSETEFKCQNAKCISNQLKCDGTDNCGDRSDERNCSCPETQDIKIRFKKNEMFWCTDGTCIARKYVCDQKNDCADSSDEQDCGVWKINIPVAVMATGFILLLGFTSLLLYKLKKQRASKRIQNTYKSARQTTEMDALRLTDLVKAASTGNDKFNSLLLRYTRLMEVSREVLEISDIVLGKGESGIIYKGLAHKLPTMSRGPTTVAVKTVINTSDTTQREKFAEELKIMTKIGRNINVINLLGIVLDANSLLLLEYCESGSLLSFLIAHRSGYVYVHVDESGLLLPNLENEMRNQWLFTLKNGGKAIKDDNDMKRYMLSTHNLMSFAHQISRGMEYLTSRSIIHRDLAARNVLVGDNQILKISDFGLAKHGQPNYMTSNVLVPLPVLWMPPEAILTGMFSQKSDIWSFGVLLWEIFSLGERPFDTPNVARFSASAFARWLLEGHRMERPSGSPLEIYKVMQLCWSLSSEERPVFKELQKKLDQLLAGTPEGLNYLSIKDSNMLLTEEYQEILNSLSEIDV